ncbi:MAG: peptide-methionine (S)-S-oxide reductase, partial [Candidatus Thorarchaeota archaeon]
WKKKIVTQVEESKDFYEAEKYHQQYYQKNPNQGYCRYIINPKIIKMQKEILPKLEYHEL